MLYAFQFLSAILKISNYATIFDTGLAMMEVHVAYICHNVYKHD